ncbi:MAG TPA: YraN family protein [Candidatus Hydrogenedentes bacterium]|nr:YraN family protein [Candidatus Hydrogenedentota bacterium]HOV74113.1 YraN family protein [Candidatus Hydrogenedentota bacterium]HPC15901.1 YraN family protein [Candidatus Hydrogenedentota bacterium]HRT19855.1 YraN family protein [Candidatus Hydrogenedentota bacterium]HRT65435.1 YraN family protein [Candidatus Hydrogenedentota bacterium]
MPRWLSRLIPFFDRAPRPLGRQGEDLAARWLRGAGYAILGRNVHIGRYEVDIIARDGDTTVFVEVKTRRSDALAPPEQNVGPIKRRKLASAARRYAARENNPGMYYRFDIVSVVIPETGRPRITLFKDAFGAQ